MRELTFRAVGEGSGKCADIDVFDTYYLHLFVWDAQANAIVGAYRLGLVDEILARYGKRGLYTHSLFKYGPRMLDALKPAIELGRSFVRAEYQRSFAPMMLLWRGIGRFIECSPQYAVLFGPVSISNSYSPASRRAHGRIPVRHMAETRLGDARQAAAAVSLSNATVTVGRRAGRSQEPSTSCLGWSRRSSPTGKGIPVLLQAVPATRRPDPRDSVSTAEFGNVLDGLMMVDLRHIEPTVLTRYMGTSGSAAFRAYHALEYDASRRRS